MRPPAAGNLWDPPERLVAPSRPQPKARRHKWIKVKVHCYLCRVCGAKKQNLPDEGYATQWTLPTGAVVKRVHTPPCEVGPMTAAVLEAHALDLAVHADPNVPHRYRPTSERCALCALCGWLEAHGVHESISGGD